MVVNHPRAVVINEEIQKKVTEFEHILIAMQVNKDDMTIAQFKTYLSADGGNRRNFMAWLRERINTYKALERFGKFKTFDDVTLQHIYQFDLFIREEQTYTTKGKPIVRSQAAIHNYHKRFKAYVSEAFRLGLIKENPYERFQDKRGEKSDRPHLTEAQLKKLIRMREESTDTFMNKYLDFFLFQTFTGMAYSDAKSFDYEQHVVTIDGKDYKQLQYGDNLQSEVQSIPQRHRLGSRLSFSFNHTCCPPYIRLYGGSWAGNIQRGAANYDGAYFHKNNRNLCEAAHAICVAEHWG